MDLTDSPAFPSTENADYVPILGITVRQYFSALAMQGLLANPDVGNVTGTKVIAEWSVEQADALIEELAK